MRAVAGILISVVILVAFTGIACGFDQTSFRIRSMGDELQWFVDDEYTDVLRNPAALGDLSENWVLTNFSNLSDGEHTPLDYDGNSYTGDSGSYLIGSFHEFGDWTAGLIADYWKTDAWENSTHSMSTSFSDYYQFNWGSPRGVEEGTWITDHDNGTETTSDDYRVIETRNGTRNRESSGLDMTLLLGTDGRGFRYDLSRTEVPSYYLGNRSHTYNLLEVGSNSAYEAVHAVQEEATSSDIIRTRHVLSYGMTRDLGDDGELDVVVGLVYAIDEYEVETRWKKQIDYDPDDDGVSHDSSYYSRDYNQYQYQAKSAHSGTSNGPGYEVSARYTRELTDDLRLRGMGEIRYIGMESDDYRDEYVSQEVMTAFEDGTGFENQTATESSGTRNDNEFGAVAAIGGALTPTKDITVGFGVKWYYDYSEALFDLMLEDDDRTGEYKKENRTTSHRLCLPVGLEYRFARRYAVRLGVNTSFYSQEYETAATGLDPENSDTQLLDVTSTKFESWNTTEYSYGFGWNLTDSLHLDMTGITDLMEIGDVLLSLTMTY